MPSPTVAWFRNDLRLADNPMLTAAVDAGRPVVALFVLDDRPLRGRWSSPNRNAFLASALRSLDAGLRERGGSLVIRRGDPAVVVPAVAGEMGASDVYVSRDYSPFARRRDARVAAALQSAGVQFHARSGRLIAEPEDVQTGQGTPFAVFSPFERKWVTVARRDVLPAPRRVEGIPGVPTDSIPGFEPTAEIPPASEDAAHARLHAFIRGRLTSYADARDLLAGDGTSRLSADLRFGLLSPRQVEVAAGTLTEPGVRSNDGARKFVSELAWREFYAHLLWHNPRVLGGNFRTDLAALPWRHDREALERWQRGETGYPIVDAAMRQLQATGWMHNRARMIAASFLTKDLLIHWREGEAFFMRHLVDGDPASNNGGWQWAASTGADPQPYFRIFNPVLQGRRFDPEGEYVRRWVPALRDVPAKYIHAPWEMSPMEQSANGCVLGWHYPHPMVDHLDARDRAIAAFTAAREAAASGS